MFSTSLIVSLLLSTQILASAERQRFSTCLRAFVDEKVEARVSGDAFDTAIGTACAQQETAYRTAYVAAAVRAGDNRASAERDATLEVEDLRENYKGIFHGYTDPQ
jgi:hypothetical protein